MDISLPIAKPPFTKLGKSLESKMRKAINEFSLFEDTDSVLIALSGGKDSLSMLYLLKAILGFGLPPLKLYAVHIEGEFSCGADVGKGFLEAICKELNVELIKKRSFLKKEEIECYGCSRERRKLIFSTASRLGIKTIAFGHHRDDDIQTLLLNTLHKGEFAGILPRLDMVHFGVRIIRPLIYISEEEIKQFASYYGFNRITCQCPHGKDSYRKKVDLLIDQIETVFPHVRKNLARASRLYGSDKAKKP